MAQKPAAALPVVDDLMASGVLARSHLVPSVRAELLTRLGRQDEAQAELALAVRLCVNDRERGLLRAKLTGLRP